MGVADYYSVSEAARVLRVTQPRIRQLLISGELEGHKTVGSDRWKIPQHAVHARLERKGSREGSVRPPKATEAQPEYRRVEELARELGRLEGRLELSEQTESTLRETLQRERQRADRLEEVLEEERSKGFWARLFGGGGN